MHHWMRNIVGTIFRDLKCLTSFVFAVVCTVSSFCCFVLRNLLRKGRTWRRSEAAFVKIIEKEKNSLAFHWILYFLMFTYFPFI